MCTCVRSNWTLHWTYGSEFLNKSIWYGDFPIEHWHFIVVARSSTNIQAVNQTAVNYPNDNQSSLNAPTHVDHAALKSEHLSRTNLHEPTKLLLMHGQRPTCVARDFCLDHQTFCRVLRQLLVTFLLIKRKAQSKHIW